MRPTGAGRRRPTDSTQDRKPPPTPTAADPWQFSTNHRDSDASFCSSRPSTASLSNRLSTVPITDKASAIRAINNYLSSHSSQFSLKPPLPSAKDITETLKFILTRLEFPPVKLEDDLYVVLKQLNCPIKLNKSALKAPGTPHGWPSLLAVIQWLLQIAMYNDHLNESSQVQSIFDDNSMFVYAMNSYLHFIRGDDDSEEMLDREFMEKLQHEKDSMEEGVNAVGESVRVLEEKLEVLKTEPSAVEVIEKRKGLLEEDVRKFHALIESLNGQIGTLEKALEEKEKELGAKAGENMRICEENKELRKRVEAQGINSRDAERMKRELQAVERDIGDAEVARSKWEEKSWEIDATIGHKFEELEALSIECNQAIKRLKLGNDFQYKLTAKGSTPAEVLGMDYKSTLKPALASFDDDIKKSSMGKWEELISLQQQSLEMAAKIEAKKNRIAALQSRIDDVEAQLNLVQRETQEYTSRCMAEAQKMADTIEADTHKLEIVEREVAEFLKNSKLKLQEAIIQEEEQTQMCARELLALVDSVAEYKEYMASKISEMNCSLSETVGSVSDLHKGSLTAKIGSILTQASDA
ncbi:hypothetical protein RHGRI_032275 [Rhododendron griersonianum]|uniref:Kinetochore protein NDC80 n=1 Tax=Rhododendron griersonianum TaxID=479676 RepID=A0AAV6IDM9_9ERIC|nr:hypothetical protein RHGRI_032275 [Rhododendron griersonianum]